MSLKILLGKFVAFFAGQIPVEGHKNIIDSFQKLIVSPKRFICAHGEQFMSNQSYAVDLKILSAHERPLERSELCRSSIERVDDERCYPRLAGKIFFSLSLKDPTQTNETIH